MQTMDPKGQILLASAALFLTSAVAVRGSIPSEVPIDSGLGLLKAPPAPQVKDEKSRNNQAGNDLDDADKSQLNEQQLAIVNDVRSIKDLNLAPSTLQNAHDLFAQTLLDSDWEVPSSGTTYKICSETVSEELSVGVTSIWCGHIKFAGSIPNTRRVEEFYHIYSLPDPGDPEAVLYYGTSFVYMEFEAFDEYYRAIETRAQLHISRNEIPEFIAVRMIIAPDVDFPFDFDPRYNIVCGSQIPFSYEEYSVKFARNGQITDERGPITSAEIQEMHKNYQENNK